MEGIIQKIIDNSKSSVSLSSIADHISDTKYIRSSYFEKWCKLASDETSIGLFHQMLLFVKSILRINSNCWEAHCTVKSILTNKTRYRHNLNEEIIRRIIAKNSSYFDSVEKYPLTQKQREAVASDEDSTLVIAGAGTGKTSTILAKIGLLVLSKQCSPQEILAISFTKKSANELTERLTCTLKISIDVSTFHKLGLDIIAKSENGKPRLASFVEDSGEKVKHVAKLISILKSDPSKPEFLHNYLEFLSFHRLPTKHIYDFKSMSEYCSWLKNNKIISLDGVPKKSYQECVITNWLLLKGVDFRYEDPYEFPTETQDYRQYCPDFFLPEFNIYIEHFGIDEHGNTAPFIDANEYRQGMEWKRALHRNNCTCLIESYSWEHEKGVLLANLENNLIKHGCHFKPISVKTILEMINSSGIVTGFSELLTNFLNLYKGNGKKLSKSNFSNDRERKFMAIFTPFFDEYELFNRKNDQIDFEDMISRAVEAVERGKFSNRYKYILIDEFQDISPGRASLLKALQCCHSDCALFAVGDDWQSIYRFTGSDIAAMTRFDSFFGATRQVALDTTFRFDDKTVNVSSRFVLKNDAQIKKKLVSVKTNPLPSIVIYKRQNSEAPLDWSLKQIPSEASAVKSVLILERYNFLLPQEDEWKRLIKSFPHFRLAKMSVHSAKGLEADYVIVGLRGGTWGFPATVVDDPMLDLVLTQTDNYPFGEERRLFYVAITRAICKTFIVCETGQDISTFASELETDKEYNINVFGADTKKLVGPSVTSFSLP